MSNTAPATNQNAPGSDPVENLAKVCMHYGIQPTGKVETDIARLAETPQFKAAFAKTQDVEMAIDELATVRTANTWLDGWYVAPDVLSYDANAMGEGKGAVVRKPGCRILGSDGRVYDIPGSPMPANVQRMTTVQIGPCTIKQDIVRGTRSAEFPSGRQVKLASHGTPLPLVDFSHYLAKLQQPVGENRLLPGDTGDFPVLTVAKVGSKDEDVVYFPQGKYDESLAVFIYDQKLGRLKVSLDPAKRQDYGIRHGADKQEILETLRGKTVLLMGKVGQTYSVDVVDLEHNGQKGHAVIESLVGFLTKMGCIANGTGKFGPSIRMSFKNTPGRTGIPVGKHEVVDLNGYKNAQGGQAWKIMVKSKAPSFRHNRSEYSVKDNDGNDQTRVSNADGFIWFPELQGRNTSRFAGLGKHLKETTLMPFASHETNAAPPVAPTATNGMTF